MKIVLRIFLLLLFFLLFSCIGKNSKKALSSIEDNISIKDQNIGNVSIYNEGKEGNDKNLIKQIIETNEIIEKEYYRLNGDSKYDIYFEIEKEGVYILDEMYNLEFIISGNNILERIYGDLLFLMNTNWFTLAMYNYKTKDYLKIPGYARLIKFISENEVEITNEDTSILLNINNDGEMGKVIEFFKQDTDERDYFYDSSIINYNYLENRRNEKNILKLFDKIICIDTKYALEASYNKRHNIFILCAYSSVGNPEFKIEVQKTKAGRG
jgi:hypothetical protein